MIQQTIFPRRNHLLGMRNSCRLFESSAPSAAPVRVSIAIRNLPFPADRKDQLGVSAAAGEAVMQLLRRMNRRKPRC